MKNKIIQVSVILCFVLGNISWAYYDYTSKQKILAQAVKEIQEAEKPSKIEELQEELENSRTKRTHYQINIDETIKDCEQKVNEIETKKQEELDNTHRIKELLEEELGLL